MEDRVRLSWRPVAGDDECQRHALPPSGPSGNKCGDRPVEWRTGDEADGAALRDAATLRGFRRNNSWQHSSKTNPSRQRFTSYDRSAATGLDYAVNRHYSSAQGRFTQVDPIGMSAVSLGDPQSLNLYAYCGNDPVNNVDPDGLFFKKLFGWIGKALKWIAIAAAIAVAVISIAFPGAWIANLAIWASKHSILSAILGINTPKFAIINLVAISAKSGAIGLGEQGLSGFNCWSYYQLAGSESERRGTDTNNRQKHESKVREGLSEGPSGGPETPTKG
ncbi:MAG: RHS repeat-associated core domain-containing protein [Acidobacteria bacterium]|nr:RHS repeat-associated core domain-containing protein [Acidobacteriota bacterium]